MYDEGSFGEAENWEELAAYLEDYDQNWCITRESEDVWRTAVLANTPYLFSLGQDHTNVSNAMLSNLATLCGHAVL